MKSRENLIESCLDPRKRNMDRNRGIQSDCFCNALQKAGAELSEGLVEVGVRLVSDADSIVPKISDKGLDV